MSTTRSLSRTVAVAGTVGAATAALVAATWLAAPDSEASGGESTSQLRSDLREARDLDGTARSEALDDIREKATSGGYGDDVKERADRLADRGSVVFALLPDELQDDLTEAKELDGDERTEALETIRDAALAGDYGAKVKEAAEPLKERADEWDGEGPFGGRGPGGFGGGGFGSGGFGGPWR